MGRLFTASLVALMVAGGCRDRSKSRGHEPATGAAAVTHRFARALFSGDVSAYKALLLRASHCRGAGLSVPDLRVCLGWASGVESVPDRWFQLSQGHNATRRSYEGILMPWPSQGGSPKAVARRTQHVPLGEMDVALPEVSILLVRLGRRHHVVGARYLRVFNRSSLPE